ncbi:MAG: hypothetical protein L0Y68_04215 [Candidatus Dadabacteria bacterium]|nr:hypothetical protein [Candidatus Dadabacteria bacterium]
MKRKSLEPKQEKRDKEHVKREKPKKEFKIEIEKVGKLEENTAGLLKCYQCEL